LKITLTNPVLFTLNGNKNLWRGKTSPVIYTTQKNILIIANFVTSVQTKGEESKLKEGGGSNENLLR
jgi:hypothetical protein